MMVAMTPEALEALCEAIRALATPQALRGAVATAGKVFDRLTRSERRRMIAEFLAAEGRLGLRVIEPDVIDDRRHLLARASEPTAVSGEQRVALLRTLAGAGLEELGQARNSAAAVLVPPLFPAEARRAILAQIDLRLMALRDRDRPAPRP